MSNSRPLEGRLEEYERGDFVNNVAPDGKMPLNCKDVCRHVHL